MAKDTKLQKLAKAFDTKGYPDDKDPSHWKTIHHTPVHIDEDGRIDGGAHGKFHGAKWSSTKHPHKATPESYGKKKPPAAPVKTAEDLRTAWKAVTKERMEIHRAKTEKGRKAHEEKLEKAYKDYMDLRAEIEARDPAEAAKHKPTTAGSAAAKKSTTSLGSLVEAFSSSSTEAEPEVRRKLAMFTMHATTALRMYARYLETHSDTSFDLAKHNVKQASEKLEGIPECEEFKAARKELVGLCKELGLKGDKLKDVFKEIKAAKYEPAKPAVPEAPKAKAASALSELAAAASEGSKGKVTPEMVAAGRAKVARLSSFDKHRKAMDDRKYAELGFTQAERQRFEADLKRIFDNSSYCMQISGDSLRKVLESGKFKNQYETKTSGGSCGSSALKHRTAIFNELLGTPGKEVSAYPPAMREKYGFIGPGSIDDTSAPRWYGNCQVRFKKDSLAGRVTYTFGDSLGIGESRARGISAGDADNPSIASCGTFLSGAWSRDGARKGKLLQAARESKDMADFMSKMGASFDHTVGYIEAQYHGDVTVSDIESVTIMSGSSSALIKKLKDAGIKVYEQGFCGVKEL